MAAIPHRHILGMLAGVGDHPENAFQKQDPAPIGVERAALRKTEELG